MRKTLLLAALSLPLLAFDCGGDDTKPEPGGFGCSLEIRGAVSENLWCIATAYDYSAMPSMPTDTWAFMLVAYRGQPVAGGALPDPAAEVGFFLAGRPALNQTHGWTESASTVDSGSASRGSGSLQAGTYEETHLALAPLFPGDAGTGSLAARFTAIPPATATGAALLGIHGTLEGTLPALDGVRAAVTIRATF
jgi:hypothetical protein